MKTRRQNYISFFVSDEEKDKIDKLMEKTDKTRSELVRFAIKYLYAETMKTN